MKFSLFRLRVVSGTLVPFVDCHPLSSSLHPALSLSTCFSPFHRRHSTHLTQLVKDIYQLFLFFFLLSVDAMSRKEVFSGEFFCFGFCLFENEWIRAFFVWSRNRHFCLLFWNWLYSSVHYNFLLFVCFSYVCNFYDFDFAVFDCVVEGLLK